MAKSGATALAFVEDLHQRTKPFFDVETEELEKYKAQADGENLAHWSSGKLFIGLKRGERYMILMTKS